VGIKQGEGLVGYFGVFATKVALFFLLSGGESAASVGGRDSGVGGLEKRVGQAKQGGWAGSKKGQKLAEALQV
jgi:hypothetical protein